MACPDRTMLGAEQRAWLHERLCDRHATWQLFATPSVMLRTWTENLQDPLQTALVKLKLVDEDGEGPDEDQWDGYPAERADLLAQLAGRDDVVVLSGDIHVSVVAELRSGDEPVAMEFTTPSLTSQNLDEKLGVAPRGPELRAAEDALVGGLDHVRWCELASHGYVIVDVDERRVRGEWWHVDTVLEPSDGEHRAMAYEVSHETAALRAVA